RMGQAAVALAKAVNYTNAGTVEYLLDREGHFYFLEMNTRIQVEHPVTELVTGTNLIHWQFAVAQGKPLPLKQTDITLGGHAMEARLCAEDPGDDFRPQQGIGHIHPGTRGYRMDALSVAGPFTVSGDYDSLVAKIIAKGQTREEARHRLREALRHMNLFGIRSNKNFLIDILDSGDFVNARVDIAWLQSRMPFSDENLNSVAAKVVALQLARGGASEWRSTGSARSFIRLRERNKEHLFAVTNGSLDGVRLKRRPDEESNELRDGFVYTGYTNGAQSGDAEVHVKGDQIHVQLDGRDALFEDITYAPAELKGTAGANVIRAPMAGRIIKVAAEPGQAVAKNQVLVILEAMKMEHELKAASDGIVDTVTAKPGDQVAIRQTLVTLKAR
ncbi:MAG: biotin/lipoyl-containing protein, partial [Micropepsaceae bacterium]